MEYRSVQHPHITPFAERVKIFVQTGARRIGEILRGAGVEEFRGHTPTILVLQTRSPEHSANRIEGEQENLQRLAEKAGVQLRIYQSAFRR